MLMCAPSFLPLVRTACAYTCVYHPLIHLPVQHAHAQTCTNPYSFFYTCLCNMRMLRSVRLLTYLSVPSLHPPTCLCNMCMLRSVRLLTHLSVPSLHPPACATCACSDLYDSLLICLYRRFTHLPVQHAHAQICTTPYWSVPSLHPHLSVQHAHAHTCVPNCTYLHTPDCPITHPTLRLLGTHISLFWGVPNCAYLHTPHCRCNHFTLLLSGTRISLFWGVSVGMERPLCGMHRTQLEVEVLQASSGICKRRQRATRNRSEP